MQKGSMHGTTTISEIKPNKAVMFNRIPNRARMKHTKGEHEVQQRQEETFVSNIHQRNNSGALVALIHSFV